MPRTAPQAVMAPPSLTTREPGELLVWSLSLVSIVAIGALDYLTGVELRIFPLYYIPVGLVAWYRGRRGAWLVAVLGAAVWLFSNVMVDVRGHPPAGIWVANTIVQGGSFALMGYLIATVRDAHLRERALARTDVLTGLLNSRAFYEEAARFLQLCRRNGRCLTLAYVDLDNFKAVNDRLGHQAGDMLLRAVADALRRGVRPSDLAARLGGDEFAVLLPEVDAAGAGVILERVRGVLAAAVTHASPEVTTSIGAATFVVPPGTVEQIVQAADALMYRAKTSGKNRVQIEVFPGDAGQAYGSRGASIGVVRRS